MDDVDGRIKVVVDEWLLLARSVLADDQRDGSMSVDMVGAVLGIVFENEDGSVFPVGAVRDSIDQAADGEIVIGHRGLWSGHAGSSAGGVIVGKAEHHEVRELFATARLTGFDEAVELVQEFISAQLVRIVNPEIGEVGIEMAA